MGTDYVDYLKVMLFIYLNFFSILIVSVLIFPSVGWNYCLRALVIRLVPFLSKLVKVIEILEE